MLRRSWLLWSDGWGPLFQARQHWAFAVTRAGVAWDEDAPAWRRAKLCLGAQEQRPALFSRVHLPVLVPDYRNFNWLPMLARAMIRPDPLLRVPAPWCGSKLQRRDPAIPTPQSTIACCDEFRRHSAKLPIVETFRSVKRNPPRSRCGALSSRADICGWRTALHGRGITWVASVLRTVVMTISDTTAHFFLVLATFCSRQTSSLLVSAVVL